MGRCCRSFWFVFFPSRLVSLITQLTVYAHLPAKSPKSLLLMKSRATSYALQLCKGSWTVTVARRGLLRRSRPGPALCPCLWCLGGLQAQPQPSCSGGLCKMSVTSIWVGTLFLHLTGVSVSLFCWNEALWSLFQETASGTTELFLVLVCAFGGFYPGFTACASRFVFIWPLTVTQNTQTLAQA